MSRFLALSCCALVVGALSYGPAHAVGEDILARSGQYTFFVKPNPCVPVTYYQRTVPCRVTRNVPAVRTMQVPYYLPVAAIADRRTIIRETPIACPMDSDPCVQCSPRMTRRPGMAAVAAPRPVRVGVTEVVIVPKCVTRRVNLPRWFMVEEIPAGRLGRGAIPAACANSF